VDSLHRRSGPTAPPRFGTTNGAGRQVRRSPAPEKPLPDGPIAGWPEAVARPGLPQIRTCGTTAYGSAD